MKNQILTIAIILFGILPFTNLYAQDLTPAQVENSIKKEGKYALLAQNSMHFQASVMTGERYKTKYPEIQFEIVLIGPIVKELAEDENLKPFVETAKKFGIRITVCEFAMQKLGIQKSQYDASIRTTPNGFTYVFGLMENGFKTISL